jgi:hypothetical protein
MSTYQVSVLRKDQSIAASEWVELTNSRALWPMVAEIAWNAGESGGQIRVTERGGEVVVLTGVNSARRGFACGRGGERASRRFPGLAHRAA